MIRLCSSATVLVELAVFGFDSAATGAGEAAGAIVGDGEGNVAGVGDGEAVAAVVDLRSLCALALRLAAGRIATSSDSRSMGNLELFISNLAADKRG